MTKSLTDKKEDNVNSVSPGKMLKVIARMPSVFCLVWKANPPLASTFCITQVLLGLVPVAQVWSLKLLVDSVPAVLHLYSSSAPATPVNLPHTIATALVLITLAWFITEIARPIEEYCREQLNDLLTRDINLLLMDKVNSIVDISILETPKFYDRLQRIQNDLMYKPVQMVHVSSQLGQASISLIGLSTVIFCLSPWLVVIIFAVCAPKLYLEIKQANEMWSVVVGDVPELRRMHYFTNVLTNNADGKEIRLFGLGNYFRSNFLELFAKFRKTRSRLRNSQLLWSLCLSGLASAGTAASYCFAVLQALNGQITTGMMAMYLGAIGQIENTLGFCAFLLTECYKHTLYLNELFEFLEIPPVIRNLPQGCAVSVPAPIMQGIEFRNVSFKYPGTESLVLDGISFKIARGETVALVGENGAGKSTIVKLLARLYDPSSGQILIDGIDLRDLNAEEWRKQMSVVFQDYCRFQLKVGENIGVGNLERASSDSAIKSAAVRSGADAFIGKLERGYDTMLGKMYEPGNGHDMQSPDASGIELSGGEWQKVALARAFMRSQNSLEQTDATSAKDAQFLILDEPTASLDVKSEHDVYCRFHELTRGKMALLITHRFSTVRIADKIIVIDNGRIIEEGCHDELLQCKSTYGDLYKMQAERYR